MSFNKKTKKPIFIDTTVFEESCCDLSSTNFELLQHVARNDFDIFTTRINEEELRKHFITKYRKMDNEIKKVIKKTRISKKYLQEYLEFSSKDKINMYDKFIQDLSDKGIKIIETYDQNISLRKIYKDYFEGNPPFNSKKEFPDALILNSISDYLTVNKIPFDQSYVISNDGHFKLFCQSKDINYFENIITFCGQLKNEKYPEEFKDIKKILEGHFDEIKEKIIENIDQGIFECGYDDYWLELFLENVVIKAANFQSQDLHIVDFTETSGVLEVTLNIDLSLVLQATFTGANQNDADWWEKEYHYETYSFDEDIPVGLPILAKLAIYKEDDEYTFDISENITPLNKKDIELVPYNPDRYLH